MKLIEPVYRLTAGLSLRVVQKAVDGRARPRARAAGMAAMPSLSRGAKAGLPGMRRSWPRMRRHGRPICCPARRRAQRLAYDELLANQLAIALVRAHAEAPARPRGQGRRAKLRRKLIAALPFTLTGAQLRALAEIGGDMAAP